jgi:SPP1 gp7 family putative phage head morphogenesis protein
MQKTLKPIYVKDSYFKPIEKDIIQSLWDLIFKPIFEILGHKKPTRINSVTDISNALRSGRIFWVEGYFYGAFNSVVGRALRDMGAKFVPSRKAYKLDIGNIPMDLRTDIVIGKGMNKAKTEAILKHLDELKGTQVSIGAGDKAAAMLDGLNAQAIKTFKVLPESLQIPYDLPESRKEALRKSYNENLELYVNNWKDEQIERLRLKAEANALIGYRADRLEKIVKNEFDVSASKAKFLARQETSLFVSKYREARYSDAGVREYIWSTSHDERVRDDHKDLNGKKFSWDSPPVVDKHTGRRANPGEDFNCRCLALPTINLRF